MKAVQHTRQNFNTMKLRIRPNAILGLGALLHIFFPLIIFLFLLYHFFILYFLKMINIIMYMYDQNIKSESKQTKLHQCFPIVKLTCYFTRAPHLLKSYTQVIEKYEKQQKAFHCSSDFTMTVLSLISSHYASTPLQMCKDPQESHIVLVDNTLK